MTAGRVPGAGAGADDGGASNRWKALAAALADDRRLRLYGRIISAADSGQPLQSADLDRTELKSLAVLEKAGLVTAAGDGALGADSGVFQNLLTVGRPAPVSSPLRLLTPGRAGNLPGRRADRLELLHHVAGEVFSRHGSLSTGTGGSGRDSGAGTSGEPGMDGADPAGSPAQLTEAEVTARLAEYSDDPAMVRRAMVDEGIVRRSPDGSRYWLAHPRPADGMEFA